MVGGYQEQLWRYPLRSEVISIPVQPMAAGWIITTSGQFGDTLHYLRHPGLSTYSMFPTNQ